MDTKTLYRHVFIQWMAKEGALDKWLTNVVNEGMEEETTGMYNTNLISGLFGWYQTPEREAYWVALYDKWEKVSPNIMIEIEKLNET